MLGRNRILFAATTTLLLAAPLPARATDQAASSDDDEAPSDAVSSGLLGDTELGTGGYAAPVVKVGKEIQGNSTFAGVQGAWQALPQVAIGAGAYALAGHVHAEPAADPKDRRYDVAYGGLRLEVTPLRSSLGSLQLALLGGGGTIVTEHPGDEKGEKKEASDANPPNGHFRVVEPELEADLAVTSFLRVGVGVGYRFVSGVDFPGLTNRELSGASGLVALKIGSF
jgi:hypothetical protein